MNRIAVIGNAGGGKTTLCRKLGAALGIPVYHIDMIQWKPGWQHATRAEFDAQHEPILLQDSWIIDGFGPFDAIEKRFRLADTIIFVDFPLRIHYWWSMKRQIKCLFIPRDDVPENCPMIPKTGELIRIMWRVHTEFRPVIMNMIDSIREGKQVVHLRSPRELRAFLKQTTS
jgi:adenylate kinase family enzyme